MAQGKGPQRAAKIAREYNATNDTVLNRNIERKVASTKAADKASREESTASLVSGSDLHASSTARKSEKRHVASATASTNSSSSPETSSSSRYPKSSSKEKGATSSTSGKESDKTARLRRQLMRRAAVAAYGISTGKNVQALRPEESSSEADKLVQENAQAAREIAKRGRKYTKKTVSVAASATKAVYKGARKLKNSTDTKKIAAKNSSKESNARSTFQPWSGPQSAPSASTTSSWVKTGTEAAKKTVSPAKSVSPKKRTLETVERPASARRSKYRKVRANAARAANMKKRAAKRSAKAAAMATSKTARLITSVTAALSSFFAIPAAVVGGLVIGLVLIVALLCPLFSLFAGASTQGGGLEGNALTVYLYLHSKGMDDVPIAAILGNMEQESRIDPSCVNSLGAHGLCQWLEGRWTRLESYASSQGKAWDDINLQLDYFYTQDEYPGASWRAEFEAMTDVDEATKLFMRRYERPGDSTLKIRQQYAREYLAKIRSGIIGTGSSIPYYYQWDSRWKDCPYGDGSTVGYGGCSPTSLAMVISAATGQSVTPDVVARWAGAKYWVNGAGTNSNAMYQAAAAKWNLGTVRRSTSISEAVTALRAGHPVISAQGRGYFTSNGHLIVLRGVSGDNILVHDPAKPENSNRTFTQSEIDAAAGSYYIFEGVTLSTYGDETNISEKAKIIVQAAKTQPSAGAHRCSTWVSYVYAHAGIYISGDAADGSNSGHPQMYENFTYSTNRSELKPGMIIAARYPDIGHVGIYIGGGMVISNETINEVGQVNTRTLDEWIQMYGSGTSWPVRWGYPKGVE